MATTIPRKATEKISELSILVTGVRIIENARIMELTDTHVTLRYRKPRSTKRWQQIFPLERVLFLLDKMPGQVEEPETEAEEGEDAAATATSAVPKRICDAVVIDTYQLDEYVDIASIDKLVGTKVYATSVDGAKVIADTSICRLIMAVSAGTKAPEILVQGQVQVQPAATVAAAAGQAGMLRNGKAEPDSQPVDVDPPPPPPPAAARPARVKKEAAAVVPAAALAAKDAARPRRVVPDFN